MYNWSVPKVNQSALFTLFNTYVKASNFDTCGSLAVNNWNCDSEHGREAVTSAYALLNFKFGNSLEVIPGMRFEHTVIDNTFWVIPYSAGVEQAENDGGGLSGYGIGSVVLGLVAVVAAVLDDPGSPRAGPPGADVTIVVFTDYLCPICKATDPALARLQAADPRVRVVYKDWPIRGPVSELAARTALAAGPSAPPGNTIIVV